MPDRVENLIDQFVALLPRLEIAYRQHVILDDLYRRHTMLMCHYANIVETDRAAKIARNCDKAIRDVAVTAITSVASFGAGFAFTKLASMAITSRAVAQGVPAAEAALFSGVTKAGLTAARVRNLAASNRAIAAAGGWGKATSFARAGNEWARANRHLSTYFGKFGVTGIAGTGMFSDLGIMSSMFLSAPGIVGAYVLNKGVALTVRDILGEPATRTWLNVAMERIGVEKKTRLRKRLLNQFDAIQTNVPSLMSTLPKTQRALLRLSSKEYFDLSADIQLRTIGQIVLQVEDFAAATDPIGHAPSHDAKTHGAKQNRRLSPKWESRLNADSRNLLWVTTCMGLRGFWNEIRQQLSSAHNKAFLAHSRLASRADALINEIGRIEEANFRSRFRNR